MAHFLKPVYFFPPTTFESRWLHILITGRLVALTNSDLE